MQDSIIDFIIPILLYAETHYSFKGIYSRLKKKEPEIIVDVPHRIEPNMSIPVLLLFKDAHLFPIKLKRVELTLIHNRRQVYHKRHQIDKLIQTQLEWQIIEVNLNQKIFGNVQLDVKFQIEINGKKKNYRNDNYRISSHKPFDIYLSQETLPKQHGWVFGDLHYHSSFTADQVEFGAPLEPTALLAKAMGLSFFAATDHSYDLDDYEDNPLKTDLDLSKWKQLHEEIETLNHRQKTPVIIIPGEEVSCGNTGSRNVHMLLLNNKRFISGKGDSAERWFRTNPDFQIDEILRQLENDAVAIAAHPEITPPFLQWLLIRRGKWSLKDYLHERLIGLQVWNSQDNKYLKKGIESWTKLLLMGERKYIFAGNDAHGNFNRFRQIGFPFWTLRENKNEIFGNARTALYLENQISSEEIIKTIKKGRAIITNGPFAQISLENENHERALIGDEISGESFKIRMSAISNHEFGEILSVKLFWGNLVARQEVVIMEAKQFNSLYSFEKTISFRPPASPGYFRLEAQSKKEGIKKCYTNPIWIKA